MSDDIKRDNFIFYNSNNKKVRVLIDSNTVWLNQKEIAEVFNTSKQLVSHHINNIILDGELDHSTVKYFLTVQIEGIREVERNIEYYDLDMVISVGYRINSKQATNFRQWATSVLKEYLIKGFVLDDERLKQGKDLFNTDYFKELLERIRSIRASERRIWQQITDIFQECSIDYDKDSLITREFFANVQNKFHYAIVGQTAPEIIYENADNTNNNMGIKTWKHSPNGRILKSDTTVAKNYLDEKQIKVLERTVSSYFDYIEGLVERRKIFNMSDFSNSINNFLEFNEYKVLKGFGKTTRSEADNKAHQEYDIYNKNQNILSDFDKQIKSIIKNNDK